MTVETLARHGGGDFNRFVTGAAGSESAIDFTRARRAAHLRRLPTPLIETPTHWGVQAFSFWNYLRDLGRNAQSEVSARSTVELAPRNACRRTRRSPMDAFGFDEDEAVSRMSLDFSVTPGRRRQLRRSCDGAQVGARRTLGSVEIQDSQRATVLIQAPKRER